VRLHPMTRFLLAAVVARIFCDGALLIYAIGVLTSSLDQPYDPPPSFVVGPLGRQFVDIGWSLLGIVGAVWVEGLARVWLALKAGRLDFLLTSPSEADAR
jgi:hypothetical protein